MKNLIISAILVSVPAFGWEKVCTFTFDKSYDGVRVSKVKVYREKDEKGTYTYAVGLSGVKVSGHKCKADERLTGYVGAKVKSTTGGYLDTGDLKARGTKTETYWKIFDEALLRDCLNGVRIWSSWVCEKAM